MDPEKAILTIEDLDHAIAFASQTKNKWSRHRDHRGYPPEMLVFGKLSRCPGAITSDHTDASHALALQDTAEGQVPRERLATRERARQAFSAVIRSQVSPSSPESPFPTAENRLSSWGLEHGMEQRQPLAWSFESHSP